MSKRVNLTFLIDDKADEERFLAAMLAIYNGEDFDDEDDAAEYVLENTKGATKGPPLIS